MSGTWYEQDVLRAVQPLELAAYLRARGWAEHQVVEGKGGVWRNTTEQGEPVELVVVTNPSLRDFSTRMADALRTLEVFEGRSYPEIVRDITTSTADVVRIPATRAELREGSIPIDLGVSLVQNARDLLLAAACSAVDRREVYITRRPTPASDFLQKARFGQTEHGSFVLTIISPVAPLLTLADDASGSEVVEQPFERQVTTTLMTALQAASSAAQRASATGHLDELKAAVASGVSANLCEAVVGLVACCDPARGLEVSTSWARTRPVASGVPTKVIIPSDTVPIFTEVARLFRETSPKPEFELRGIVIRLERPENASEGTVTVLGIVDDRPRRVEVKLGPDAYAVALRAHEAHLPVVCLGELRKKGNGYVLDYARHFSLDNAG